MVLHFQRTVAQGEDKLREALIREDVHDVADQRPIVDFDKRLGTGGLLKLKPPAVASGQHDCLQTAGSIWSLGTHSFSI